MTSFAISMLIGILLLLISLKKSRRYGEDADTFLSTEQYSSLIKIIKKKQSIIHAQILLPMAVGIVLVFFSLLPVLSLLLFLWASLALNIISPFLFIRRISVGLELSDNYLQNKQKQFNILFSGVTAFGVSLLIWFIGI
jgi:hypothetical protein